MRRLTDAKPDDQSGLLWAVEWFGQLQEHSLYLPCFFQLLLAKGPYVSCC